MTVVKVLELVGVSRDGFQDAVNEAVMQARDTVRGISGVEVVNLTADVDNDEIVEYKANVKVAFRVEQGGIT
ncbi:MAG: dodecin family protein [Bacillota bacterium]